jgi:hypothetical protein
LYFENSLPIKSQISTFFPKSYKKINEAQILKAKRIEVCQPNYPAQQWVMRLQDDKYSAVRLVSRINETPITKAQRSGIGKLNNPTAEGWGYPAYRA